MYFIFPKGGNNLTDYNKISQPGNQHWHKPLADISFTSYKWALVSRCVRPQVCITLSYMYNELVTTMWRTEVLHSKDPLHSSNVLMLYHFQGNVDNWFLFRSFVNILYQL